MRSNEKLLLSPGFQTVDICHVDDIAKAYVLTGRNLLNSSSSICSRYGISASKISVRELVKEFEDVCGKKLPVEWGARPYWLKEVMTPMWCNVALLPGWQVNISLRKGFSNLINACD
jgi:nucleoside-diphosphate-sugar epimerase